MKKNRYITFICTTISCLLLPVVSFAVTSSETAIAIFAGGCFWTMQYDFDKVPGVIKTTAGYTGGTVPSPSYEQVENGTTGHYESVQVMYNPAQVSYQQLLDTYWHNTDPTNGDGQFCDSGSQYRPVIFYSDDKQKELATESKQQLINSKRFANIATQILPASVFYPAEEYHQEFYRKNPLRYNLYRTGCGRDHALQAIWNTNN